MFLSYVFEYITEEFVFVRRIYQVESPQGADDLKNVLEMSLGAIVLVYYRQKEGSDVKKD